MDDDMQTLRGDRLDEVDDAMRLLVKCRSALAEKVSKLTDRVEALETRVLVGALPADYTPIEATQGEMSPSPAAYAAIKALARGGWLLYGIDGYNKASVDALTAMARAVEPFCGAQYGQAHSGPRDGGVEES